MRLPVGWPWSPGTPGGTPGSRPPLAWRHLLRSRRRARPGRTPNPRYLALLRIDAEAFRRGHVHGDELCEITGIGPVPVSVARGLLGEAILKLVITNGVAVANITRVAGPPPRNAPRCCGPTPPARYRRVTAPGSKSTTRCRGRKPGTPDSTNSTHSVSSTMT